ncbi:hypothetical protein [Fusobacterium varium]|uniref:hypothetical protein n=1 Tax=Fusobacterium varium TaxID=856 RepID=UPI003F0F1BE2
MDFEIYLINLKTKEREKFSMNFENIIEEFKELKYLFDKNNKYNVNYANFKNVVIATMFYGKEPVTSFFFAHKEDKKTLIEILKKNNQYNFFHAHEKNILGYRVIEEKYFNEIVKKQMRDFIKFLIIEALIKSSNTI